MVAVGLSGIILTGIVSANLHMIQSGLRMTNFTDSEIRTHRAFDQLGRDLKGAVDLTWNSATDITLTIPVSDTTMTQVTYAWSANDGIFYRVAGANSAVTTGRTILLKGNPTSGRSFTIFSRLDGDGVATSSDDTTRIVSVKLPVKKGFGPTVAATTETNMAATFTLRNKASF